MFTLAKNLPLCDKMTKIDCTCSLSSKNYDQTMHLCNSSLHIPGQRRGVLNCC